MQVWPDSPKLQLFSPNISYFLPQGFSHGIYLMGCCGNLHNHSDSCVSLKVPTWKCKWVNPWPTKITTGEWIRPLPSFGWTIERHIYTISENLQGSRAPHAPSSDLLDHSSVDCLSWFACFTLLVFNSYSLGSLLSKLPVCKPSLRLYFWRKLSLKDLVVEVTLESRVSGWDSVTVSTMYQQLYQQL